MAPEGAEDGDIIVYGLDDQSIGEGLDPQLGQQGSLRRPHLVPFLDQLHRRNDLHYSLVDLHRDVENLEKRSL